MRFLSSEKKGKISRNEVCLKHKEGTVIDATLDLVKINPDRIIAFCRYISVLKQTEYELVLKNILK